MPFGKPFGGAPSDRDDGGGPPPQFAKKAKSKPFGKKGGFQKKGFSPAQKSMRGGGRF